MIQLRLEKGRGEHTLKTTKRILSSLIIITLFFSFFPKTNYADDFLNLQGESAILIEADTGKVLFQKYPDLMLPPASMTKMMTEYLVLEAIAQGKVSWEQTTSISEFVYTMSQNRSLSNVPLRKDGQYTVKELYESMAIYSANAATIALTELIAGSETNFVKMMNDKAAELKLPDYKFVNSTGLNNADMLGQHPQGTGANEENMLSARSTALLAYHLLKDYPEVLDTASIPFKVFREGTSDAIDMPNWNYMLPGLSQEYDGVDGLKTGMTDLAKNCFTGTAVKDGMRLISVVMKSPTRTSRFTDTKKVFDYGFSNFTIKELYPADFQIEDNSELNVVKGKEKTVEIKTTEPLKIVMKIGEEEFYKPVYYLNKELFTEDNEMTAPIAKGDKVGYMTAEYSGNESFGFITVDGEKLERVDVVTTSDVEKAGWFTLMLRGIGEFFSNIWASIAQAISSIFA
jgi:serine-type D-Ala-D-Ala carboxypeptidase (penicillin-binding protein 5/6)